MSLLLNALFHHSLMMIPQQEIPGTVPSAFVMRHPETGNVEVPFFETIKKIFFSNFLIYRSGGHHVPAENAQNMKKSISS